MVQDIVTRLLSAVRESIARLAASAEEPWELAVLRRALAHLCSAQDELDALSTRRLGRGG
jgi:hypothetical protein